MLLVSSLPQQMSHAPDQRTTRASPGLTAGLRPSGHHAETDQDLLPQSAIPRPATATIAIESFQQSLPQTVNQSGYVSRDGDISGTWTVEPDARDVSRFVAVSLRRAGFREVSYQPNAPGYFRVRGHVEKWQRTAPWPGRTIFAFLQSITFCTVPMYFEGGRYEAVVNIAISDAQGNLIQQRREPVIWTPKSTCIWGSRRVPDVEVVGTASGTVVATLLSEMLRQADPSSQILAMPASAHAVSAASPAQLVPTAVQSVPVASPSPTQAPATRVFGRP